MDTQQIDEKVIFNAARQIADDAVREDFLTKACGGDEPAIARVRDLLRVHLQARSFLESPAPGLEGGPTIVQPIAERPGTIIGPYKLLQQIGEGGMGVVFMAEQTEPIQRIVALKIIKPGMDTRQVIARFEAERQALAMMDHPNIAKVLDAGTTQTGRPYFVMDLVKGVPVTEYCDRQQLPVRQRLELVTQVCQAVHHAHQKGIIHRDIKPSNVLVAEYDNHPIPKVIDFGVAKATAQKLTERTMFTEFGQVIGTVEYMSPEQAKFNQLDIDTRSDIYSLGVLLYELLTGSTPFERSRLREVAFDEVLRIIREEEPPAPSTRLSDSETLPAIAANRHTEPARLNKEVRGELDWIAMKCLEKDRNRRYETANSLAIDLHHYLNDEPVTACPPSAAYRFRKFVRRNKAGVTLAAVVLSFLVLTGGGIGWAVRDRAAREAFFAREQADRQVALEKGVRAALDEVKEWHRRENWTAATAAVKRAEGLLAAGAALPALEQNVRQWRADLDTVARLEEILLAYQTNEQHGWDYRPAALAGYQQEFRSLGIDIDALSSDEAAARMRTKPICKQLIAALDDWAQVRQTAAPAADQPQPNDLKAWRQRPLVVARAVDDDGFCNRIRDAWLASGPTEIENLARLPEAIHLPPSTLDLLERRVKDGDVAIGLLTQAHYAHADDFRINLLLALRLLDVEGSDVRKLYNRKELRPAARIAVPAVAYANAAVALQPNNPWAWLVLGQALEQTGRLDGSNAAHRKAIELKPEFFGAYIELGRNLYRQGKLDESLAASRRAIELNPKIPGAHVNAAIALFEQKHFDDAVAGLREAIKIDPNFSPAHSNLGTLLCDKGRLDESIAEFKLALSLRPDDADDYSSMGRALTLRGDVEDGIAACRKAIALSPDHAVAYSNLGAALRANGKLSDAVSALRKAIELRPDDATTYCELGVTLRQLGQIEDAIAAYRTAIKIDPEKPCSYTNLGAILLERKEFEAALEAFRTVAQLKPNDALSHSNLGIVLKDLGRFDEAIAECRKAIELEPESSAAHRSLGNVLHASGQLGPAIVTLRRAIELKPDYAEAYCDLGEALEDHGQVSEAIDASRKAVELDPKCVSAYNNLASALFTLDKTDDAVAALRTAIELDPKQAVSHHNLGNILSFQGRPDEALAEYRKAIDYDPNDADSHAGLAEVLQLQGKRGEALLEFEKAIKLRPDIDTYRKLASLLSDARRYDEAIGYYGKIIALKPDDAGSYADLGGHLQAAGRFVEAIEACRKAIQLQPNNGDAHNNLGNAFKKSKRLEEALAEYRKAAEVMPEYPGAVINVAQTLDVMGKHDEATTAYRQALKLKLDDAAMCNGVAWTMAASQTPEDRHPAEAVAFAARATELAPQEGSVWNTLGVARYRNAEWQPAIEALEKSMNLRAGGDSSDWFFLAMAYWQKGDKDKARTWYDKAVEWMDHNAPQDKDLSRFAAEAAELLGIGKDKPATSK